MTQPTDKPQAQPKRKLLSRIVVVALIIILAACCCGGVLLLWAKVIQVLFHNLF